eukprot:jgi/Mesvir1/18311/Mv18464-RA.1
MPRVCRGTTRDGYPCRYAAVEGSKCRRHATAKRAHTAREANQRRGKTGLAREYEQIMKELRETYEMATNEDPGTNQDTIVFDYLDQHELDLNLATKNKLRRARKVAKLIQIEKRLQDIRNEFAKSFKKRNRSEANPTISRVLSWAGKTDIPEIPEREGMLQEYERLLQEMKDVEKGEEEWGEEEGFGSQPAAPDGSFQYPFPPPPASDYQCPSSGSCSAADPGTAAALDPNDKGKYPEILLNSNVTGTYSAPYRTDEQGAESSGYSPESLVQCMGLAKGLKRREAEQLAIGVGHDTETVRGAGREELCAMITKDVIEQMAFSVCAQHIKDIYTRNKLILFLHAHKGEPLEELDSLSHDELCLLVASIQNPEKWTGYIARMMKKLPWKTIGFLATAQLLRYILVSTYTHDDSTVYKFLDKLEQKIPKSAVDQFRKFIDRVRWMGLLFIDPSDFMRIAGKFLQPVGSAVAPYIPERALNWMKRGAALIGSNRVTQAAAAGVGMYTTHQVGKVLKSFQGRAKNTALRIHERVPPEVAALAKEAGTSALATAAEKAAALGRQAQAAGRLAAEKAVAAGTFAADRTRGVRKRAKTAARHAKDVAVDAALGVYDATPGLGEAARAVQEMATRQVKRAKKNIRNRRQLRMPYEGPTEEGAAGP